MRRERVYQTTLRFPSSVYVKKVDKVWGRELWFTNTPWFCSKLLVLNGGYESSRHYHTNKIEEFVVLDGVVHLELPDQTKIMQPGDRHLIHPETEHKFSSVGPALIFEFSTHHDEADVTRLTDSGPIDANNAQAVTELVSSVQ